MYVALGAHSGWVAIVNFNGEWCVQLWFRRAAVCEARLGNLRACERCVRHRGSSTLKGDLSVGPWEGSSILNVDLRSGPWKGLRPCRSGSRAPGRAFDLKRRSFGPAPGRGLASFTPTASASVGQPTHHGPGHPSLSPLSNGAQTNRLRLHAREPRRSCRNSAGP